MRGDRQVERFCEVGDLHENGDAAAVGHVGLGIGDAAGRDHLLELPQRAEVLACGDRHTAVAHDARVAGHVIGDGRLLEPDQFELRATRGRGEWIRPPSISCWRRP